MKRSRLTKRQPFFLQKKWIWAFSLLIGIPLGVFCYHLLSLHSVVTSPMAEDEAHMMKKIPPKIEKIYKTASISATLRVPILMYHYVEVVKDKRDTIRQSLDILPTVFEKQIETLQEAGYSFLTAGELGEVLDGKRALPTKSVVLTFDDGYRDFYTDVFPILEKHQVKATSYIIAGFLGGQNYMTPDMVASISASGLVEIGGHTITHPSLKGMSFARAEVEVTKGRQMLEQEFHVPVVSFAYPYGTFDEQAIAIAKQAGFTTAVSTIPGIEENQADRFFLFRIRPGYRTGQSLLDYLEQTSFKPY
jgi:peptidoglycan/xylan/chitin deacetylase (PgdA/CDA1 family)